MVQYAYNYYNGRLEKFESMTESWGNLSYFEKFNNIKESLIKEPDNDIYKAMTSNINFDNNAPF